MIRYCTQAQVPFWLVWRNVPPSINKLYPILNCCKPSYLAVCRCQHEPCVDEDTPTPPPNLLVPETGVQHFLILDLITHSTNQFTTHLTTSVTTHLTTNLINHLTTNLIDQPTKHPTEHPTDHPTDHPPEHTPDHPPDHPPDRQSDHQSDTPLDQPPDHPINHPPDHPTD